MGLKRRALWGAWWAASAQSREWGTPVFHMHRHPDGSACSTAELSRQRTGQEIRAIRGEV